MDNNPPDPDPNLTTRERFAVHTNSPACSHCHQLIDPVGFGFEAYDQLGRFRSKENGKTIDTSGEFIKLTETSMERSFDNAEQLANIVAESETILSCLAKKWFTFSLGRPHLESDSCALEEAVNTSMKEGGSMQELLIALCKSDAFRYRATNDSDGKVQ